MRLCPTCSEPLNLQSPYIHIDGPRVRVYCSEDCKGSFGLPDDPPVEVVPPRRRGLWLLGGAFVAGSALFSWRMLPGDPEHSVAIVVEPNAVAPAESGESVDAGALPSDAAVEQSPNDLYWTGELASDHWVHPLSGPKRRMPVRDSRVFGAERPGDRPPECYRGHCGVDIGGEAWGEPVLAAADGVVDRVVRGPNTRHGGLYVRIAHRGGTVFTQYFHLAAIPRWIRPDREIQAGQVIGLVGQTGVKNSGPHLHFTISVKPGPDEREQFIDPEPLIALWPVSIPIYNHTMSIASTHVVPGVPRRGAPKKRPRKRRTSRPDRSAAPVPATPASSPTPTPDDIAASTVPPVAL